MEKISGFSIVRNGVEFGYPFLESYRSLLPWVDELWINVGIGTDSTLKALESFASQEGQGKVKLVQHEWPLNDPEKKKAGVILSEQTNLALEQCRNDWCIYLQADEVLHESDFLPFRQSLQKAVSLQAEAIVFQYRHFYGSFDVVQKSRSAYRREVRAVRKSSGAKSVGDAQSFLSFKNGVATKPQAVLSNARIFHYGWVRPPETMKQKTYFMDQLYHGTPDASQSSGLPQSGNNYQYKKFWGLLPFQKGFPGETHPSVMKNRIAEQGWSWDLAKSEGVFRPADLGKALLDGIESLTGERLFEFKNYQLIG